MCGCQISTSEGHSKSYLGPEGLALAMPGLDQDYLLVCCCYLGQEVLRPDSRTGLPGFGFVKISQYLWWDY